MVGDVGYDPTSPAFQAGAFTRLAYHPILLVGRAGIEPAVGFPDGFTIRCHTL